MDNKSLLLDTIGSQGLLPLYYQHDKIVAIKILRALYEGGVRVVEWTNRGENALKNFEALRNLVNDELPGLYLGTGTIKTQLQAMSYINAGADFIVSPAMISEVAETVNDKKLLYIPGCMTPTEIAVAEAHHASIIKIFPATALGPSFISAVKEVFPGLKFMSTGGILPQKELLEPWFSAGVTAVGIGGSLISKLIIENEDFGLLTTNVRKLLHDINEIRK